MATITGGITGSIAWRFRDSNSTTNIGSFGASIAFTNGTGTNQVDGLPKPQTYTIAASSTQNIDLAGTLTDYAGSAVVLTKFKGLYIKLKNTTAASSITVGGGTNGVLSGSVPVHNGGIFVLGSPTGYTVTAGTGDILRIVNNDASLSAEVEVGVIGNV